MQFLTVKKLSKVIGVKPSTLYAWAGRGMIPCYKLNGLLRFELAEIEAWVVSLKTNPKPSKKTKFKPTNFNEIDGVIKRVIESTKDKGYNLLLQGNQTDQPPKGGS